MNAPRYAGAAREVDLVDDRRLKNGKDVAVFTFWLQGRDLESSNV